MGPWVRGKAREGSESVSYLDVGICVGVPGTHFLRSGDKDIPKDGPPPVTGVVSTREPSVSASEGGREGGRGDALVEETLRSLDRGPGPRALVDACLFRKRRRGFSPSSFLFKEP